MVDDVADEQNPTMESAALAARCASRTVLITADCTDAVEGLARRIHAASARAAFPFVLVAAATLPIDAAVLAGTCADLLDGLGGGSLLITDVEQMPALVQDQLIETLASLQAACEPTRRVRLIAGTTAIFHDRISDGTFSDRLFYRLNVIHVIATTDVGARRPAAAVA
jgi:DNA-binding NtrC family response regulator